VKSRGAIFSWSRDICLFLLFIFFFSPLVQSKESTENDLDAVRSAERKFYLVTVKDILCREMDGDGKLPKNFLDARDFALVKKVAAGKKDSDAILRAKALMGAVLRLQGDFNKAVELLSSCSEFDNVSLKSAYQYKSSYLACFLELAHCFALEGAKASSSPNQNSEKLRGNSLEGKDLASAFKMLYYAERNTTGYDNAFALFKYGDVLFSLCEFRKSEDYLNRAKSVLSDLLKTEKRGSSEGGSEDSFESLSELSERKNSDIFLLKERIEALLSLVFIELLEEDYGEAYALYVKARSFYDENSFEAAMFVCRKVFTKYPETVYEQALRLTYADCLVSTGEVDEAKKWLLGMLKKYPKSPYLGEAMMRLGKIYLEKDWNAEKASEYYRQALGWFRSERERKNALDIYTVPENVAKVSASADPFSSIDKWGRTIYRNEKPTEIITAQSAPWYVSEMEKECLFMMGLFFFADGKFAEAKECFINGALLDRAIMELDAKKVPNILMRLRGACDQGFLQTSSEHMSRFKGASKLRLFLADFYWTLEKYPDVIAICDGIAKDPKLGSEEKAYALAIKARALCSMGKVQDAEKIYLDVYKNYRKTLAAGYSLMQLGFIANSRGGLKAIEYYRRCILEFPETSFAECSLARCVYTAELEKDNSLSKYANEYLKKYPDGRYADAVKKSLSKVKNSESVKNNVLK